MDKILGIIFLLIWLYVLHVLKKSKLPAWRYFWGSCGLFILLLLFVQPFITEPLAHVVASIAGGFGNMVGMFSSYFKYGVIFVQSQAGAISLHIDFECSGVLEIMAFLSLLFFYEVYSRYERIIVGVVGVAYIIFANALRIILICAIIHFFGRDAYQIAHTYIGRIFFYGLSIMMYFIVFTKPQILRQKVGGFSYGNNK